MAETSRAKYDRRLKEMQVERQSYIPHWQELGRFLSPRVGKYLEIDRNRGQKKNQDILNTTALEALRTLKSGMHAGMTSQSRPWFRLTTDDPELMKRGAVKEWLYRVEESMRIVFSRSNFYNTMPQIYGACGGHGTAAMAILEDHEKVIRCQPFPIGSYFLALNDKMRVDTFYRQFSMTVIQLVGQFGLDNVSNTVRNLYDRCAYEQPVKVTHVVEPNFDRDTRLANNRNMPFRSVYYESGSTDNKFLGESGFEEFPIISPRWEVEGDDVYGFCPGMDALGVVKGVQLYEMESAKAAQKIVNPPMLIDSSMRTERHSLLPGDTNYVNNLAQHGRGMQPVHIVDPIAVQIMDAKIATMCQEIDRIFFKDLMMMFAISDASNITAREVEERHQEKLLVLGPVIERFGEELYDPAIDRTFSLMSKRGMIPPAPQEIQGQVLKVEYISIMAQAQKLVGTASLERVTGYVGNVAQYHPSALDKLNIDAAIDEYAAMHGVPPNVINSDEEVKAIRGARAQQEQAQKMMAAAPAMADAATAAKTLSETDIQGTTALARMLGAA